MSESLRIALVAEGPTDLQIIQAALKAILPRAFVLTLLQPEPTQPHLGTGWGGVLKWCHQEQPPLQNFDLLVIHVDVDVASQQYENCGPTIVTWAADNQWGALPCSKPCPPVADTVTALAIVVESWLGQRPTEPPLILCLPAQSSGTWLAAAVLASDHPLLIEAECRINLESQLSQLPRSQRIRKTVRDYRDQAVTLTAQWQQVKQVCSQAAQFEQLVLQSIPPSS